MNDGGCVAISPHRSGIVFCVGNVYNAAYFVGVSHSSDDGATWERDTIPLGTRGWAIAFDPFDSNRVYVGGDSAYSYPCLLVTTDMGRTWTQSRAGLSGAVNALATVPGESGLVYAGTSSGVFKSTNGGASWAGTGLTSSTRALLVDPDNPNTLYAGTASAGVYVSTNAGSSWNQQNAGLTNLRILSLAMRGGPQPMLFAGTEGGSVFRSEVMTGLAGPSRPGAVLPAIRIIPNPVRGSARLELETSTALPFRAGLYDHTGRFVLDLGPRLVQHGGNGLSFSTGGIPAGVYFVRVATGTRTHVARLEVVE